MTATLTPLIDAQELAERWGLRRAAVYALVEAGLPVTRIGQRRLRFDFDECVAWLEEQQEVADRGALRGGKTWSPHALDAS